MKEWKLVTVDDSIAIHFVALDPTPGGSNLGRAEFTVCQIFKYGKPKGYFVYPRQQRDVDTCWYVTYVSFQGISIGSYGNIDPPRVWNTFWCKDHKTMGLDMYVPNNSRILHLDRYGLRFE